LAREQEDGGMSMTKFDLLPRAWYSQDYRLLRDGAQLTHLHFESGPERSVFALAGEVYRAQKEKWNSSNFFLYVDQTQIARAEKPNWYSQTIYFEHQNQLYTLNPGFNRFTLSCTGIEVGSITKRGWFSRSAAADMPEEFPLPVSIFIIWLVLLMWKRTADSDAAV
jgi:hypothetical protein